VVIRATTEVQYSNVQYRTVPEGTERMMLQVSRDTGYVGGCKVGCRDGGNEKKIRIGEKAWGEGI
jgi:hypothetical protein